jgi:hypothetical protein
MTKNRGPHKKRQMADDTKRFTLGAAMVKVFTTSAIAAMEREIRVPPSRSLTVMIMFLFSLVAILGK